MEAILRGNHFYEEGMLEYIAALALPGVYIDVGAYIGTHSLYFATFCPATRVLSFEPRPHVLEHLRHNVDVNQLGDTVAIHPWGLSDREETITVQLDRKQVSFACRPLDQVTSDLVAVIKLDVEGMEEKVLAGATQILARSRPLLFAEAHDGAALASLLHALSPYGYQPTGRVFNDTATYELASSGSPAERRLPSPRSLLDPRWWIPDNPALLAEVTGDRIRVESRLDPEQVAHLTAEPTKLTKPPREAFFTPAPNAIHFVQTTGRISRERLAWLYLMEYRGAERINVQRYRMVPNTFQRIDLHPASERVRLAIRVSGPGELELDEFAIHTLGPRA